MKRAKKLGPWTMWVAVHENGLLDWHTFSRVPPRWRVVRTNYAGSWKIHRVRISIVRSKSKRRKQK